MKKILLVLTAILLIIGFACLASCKPKKEIAKTACAPSPTFAADVKPIFEGNCMPCHNSEKHKNNIDLSSYATSKDAAKGKNFLGSLKHEPGYDPMPMKKDKLNDETIGKISCWIQNGMPE